MISGPCSTPYLWLLNEIEEFKNASTLENKAMEALDVLSFRTALPNNTKITSVDISEVEDFAKKERDIIIQVFPKWKLKKESKYGYAEWRTLKNIISF